MQTKVKKIIHNFSIQTKLLGRSDNLQPGALAQRMQRLQNAKSEMVARGPKKLSTGPGRMKKGKKGKMINFIVATNVVAS